MQVKMSYEESKLPVSLRDDHKLLMKIYVILVLINLFNEGMYI